MLDLYKLEIFMLVVQEGSFSGAAERLYMTQPGVSQHIQDLEATFGTQLFQRGRRGVTLTTAGQTLHQYAERIFQLVTEVENAVTDVKNLAQGQLRIGATPGISIYLLPDWIQTFRSQYPNLTVELQTAITPQIVQDMRVRRIDLGFLEGELDEATRERLTVQELLTVDQFVIIGRQHPWWDRGSIASAELNGQPFVMRQRNSQTRIWLDEMLQKHDINPRVEAEFDNLESIKRVVAAGTALTILPEYVVRMERDQGLLRVIPIQGRPLQRILKLVWAKDVHSTPVVSAFLKHLQVHFPHIQGIT